MRTTLIRAAAAIALAGGLGAGLVTPALADDPIVGSAPCPPGYTGVVVYRNGRPAAFLCVENQKIGSL